MSLATAYIDSVTKRFIEYKSMGDKTFAQLEDSHFHLAPNEVSNSIAVIIRHLHGNMLSRWTNFLTEDGEKPWRHRDDEFENTALTRTQLLQLWEEGWKVLLDTLTALKEEDLTKTITIRSQPLGVVDAINRQLAHYASHIGQIVYLGRWIKKENWITLSIPRGHSEKYNAEMHHTRP